MNCKKCAEMLQEYLEHSLTEEMTRAIDEHIRSCEECRICFRTYSLTVRLSKKVTPSCNIPTEMMDRLREVLIKKMSDKQ